MCRIYIISIIAILILNGYVVSTANVPEITKSSLKVSDFEDTTDTENVERLNTKELEQLGSIVYVFRKQFRYVIEELINQALKYLSAAFHELKLRVFQKLGRYTLSDVFHATFDGVADFVIDSTTDAGLVLNNEEEFSNPIYGYSHYPYVPSPYDMRSGGIMKKMKSMKGVSENVLRNGLTYAPTPKSPKSAFVAQSKKYK